ncbi:MAG: nucleotidyltransferase domain-containing protein [Chloroflexi bacterium]|nr:nucleotidyltransferase domain-containing protein [Chloroflexota bacterium]
MTALLTEPVASTLLVLDQTESATLTEVARATGRPVSTIQRAVDRLLASDLVLRSGARGRLRISEQAPRRALRELATWRLGAAEATRLARAVVGGRTATARLGSMLRATGVDPVVSSALIEAIELIGSTYRPERVILFGSHARGDARPDSDVDLLVVFDRDVDRREMRLAIRRLLGAMPFAKDIVVAAKDDLARTPNGSVVAEAVREGLTVYER